jgi:hypothetical protein
MSEDILRGFLDLTKSVFSVLYNLSLKVSNAHVVTLLKSLDGEVLESRLAVGILELLYIIL